MKPLDFNQVNAVFGPPAEIEETQVHRIPAYVGTVERGSCEGARLVVVAWLPNEAERELIAQGMPVFVSMLGGLAPHFLSVDFNQAISPA